MMEFSLLNLLLVLLVAALGGAVANRFGYPSLIGEMLAGMLFGPGLLGWLHATPGLELLGELGVFLMMLYIGIEVDHRDLMKASWPGMLAAAGAFVFPVTGGYLLLTVGYGEPAVHGWMAGLVMGVTSLATKSRALMELKLLGTRMANVMLAGALVCDTLALVGFAAITGLAGAGPGGRLDILIVLAKSLVFFGVAIAIGLRVFPWIGRLLRKFGFTERSTNFTLVIMVGLVFAEMAEIAGLHSIIGAFIAGLFIREEVLKRKVSMEVSAMVRSVSIGFLAPVFFVIAGFNLDIAVLWTDPGFVAICLAVAVAAKVAGTVLFYLPTRLGWREGLVIGMGMNGQGAVAIVIAEVGRELGLVDQRLFSMLIVVVFFTTLCEPLFIELGSRWLRRRGQLVRADDERELVMLAGASPLARLIGRALSPGGKVCLIDNNNNLVQAAVLEGINALKGNVLSEDLLDICGAAGARAFIAMTTNQEVNRRAAEMARDMFGVPLAWEWPGSGGGDIPLNLHKWNEWIMRREVESISFSAATEQTFQDYGAMAAAFQGLPLVVERNGRKLPAMAVDALRKGDLVRGIRHHALHAYQQDVFEELIRACPIIDVRGKTGAETIFAMAGRALEPVVGMSASTVADKLLQREQESSTVVAPGVAIPHIILDGDQPVAMLLARSRDGAEFLTPGLPPVEFTFVIVGARSARNLHLRILSAIAQLFQDPGFEDLLLAAPDAEGMRHVILNTRRRRF